MPNTVAPSPRVNVALPLTNDLNKHNHHQNNGEILTETEVDESTADITLGESLDRSYNHNSSLPSIDGSNRTTPLPTTNTEIVITSPISSSKKLEDDQILSQQEDAKPLNANLESLTINKLHYDDVGMIGREAEFEVLKACFGKLTSNSTSSSSSFTKSTSFRQKINVHRPSFALVPNSSRRNIMLTETPPKQLVWIKGYSGCGKSTLAKTLEDLVGDTDQGLLLEAKYDQHLEQPCSGILAAFGQIFQHLAQNLDLQVIRDTATNIVDQLVLALGPELDTLVQMIPYLDQVVQQQNTSLPIGDEEQDDTSSLTSASEGSSSHDSDLHYGFGARQELIKYCMRILTRVLSSYFSPLVIVLDDLQWADSTSLELLEYLLLDKQNLNPVMFVGCYRSNEVLSKNGHILTNTIQSLASQQSKCNFEMTDLGVGNFDVSTVHQVLRKLLGMDSGGESSIAKTLGLAELVHKRTLGNPHFVLELMTMLYDEGLLEYNLSLMKWTWDEYEMERMTMSTDNVVDLFKSRMKKLSPELQQLLKYAACLGAWFHKEPLDLVYSEHSGAGPRASAELQSTKSLLLKLEQGNYVQCQDGTYVWVHDRLQEAAFKLIGKSSNKNAFQFQVGCILYNSLDKNMLDEYLFTVADLINQGHVKRRFDFAELNLKAARKAQGLSAFHSAAAYVNNGIQLLPNEKWTANFSLTLKLYCLGAQVALAVGNQTAMERYYREGISQQRCSTEDKLPLYIARINKLSSIDGQSKECVNFILGILKKFGCNLVKNKALVRREANRSLLKTRDMIQKLPKHFHQSQPPMTDPKQKAIMILLSKMWYICSSEGLYWVQCLGTTKMVQMTIQHGVHDSSGSGFAAMAMALVGLRDDWEEATAIAETALLLQRRVQNEYTAALTYFQSVSCVFTWTSPLQGCLSTYMDGFQAGMRSGNVISGTWCLLAHHILVPFISGKNMKALLDRAPDVLHQLEEVKQDPQLWYLKMLWQLILNLSGESQETKELKGEIFDVERMPWGAALANFGLHWGKLLLCNHYGDWQSAAKIALEFGNFSQQQRGAVDFLCQSEAFHRGLALYAVARQSNNRKYTKGAKQALNLLAKWVNKGCPNVRHFHTLLKAEQASLDKKYEMAETLYKEAIIMAARPGMVHDAAIFNARYSAFLNQQGSYFTGLEDEAKYRLQESIRYYEEWGAKKIVVMLTARLQRM